MGLIAKVAVEGTTCFFDKPFDYYIDENFSEQVKVGCRVLVNFGNSKSNRQGIVLELNNHNFLSEPPNKLKPILALLDKEPLLSEEMVMLISWLSETTFCTLFESAKLMLPVGINLKINRVIALTKAVTYIDIENRTDKEQEIITYLLNRKGKADFEKLLEDLNIKNNSKPLRTLIDEDFFEFSDNAVQKTSDASVKKVRLTPNNSQEQIKLTPKQKEVYNLLLDIESSSVKEICYFLGVTNAVVNGLVNKGLAELYDDEVMRNPYKEATKTKDASKINLTNYQEQAYKNLINQYNGNKGTSLLYGVTGSGKTSVFLKMINYMLSIGKSVIVMVPEISLTPQLMETFHSYFGSSVAIFHSGLSIGERMDEFKRVKRKEATIVVGTRSAVFAPLENIGLIVMDEEQEYSYKSEKNPRFHARNVAKFRCGYNKALLLLASATPSVESFYMAKNGGYTLNCLPQRYGNAKLPKVEIVDLTKTDERSQSGNYSQELLEALDQNLHDNMQSILLLNRRGYHTFAVCGACRETVTCPNCSISLTYHSANSRLMCHYCGYSVTISGKCPSCGKNEIRYGGFGTQRAEQELEEIFPEAKILRMDTDSTMAKHSYETKLKQFSNGEYDIMVGTQMVAKGLNFPKVTLVGVLSADQSLYSDDFRSYEKTFSLLTQVVGRSGRGEQSGKAIIQTITPQNHIIELSANQDYDSFYNDEIMIRKVLLYPPFSDICVVGFISLKNEMAKNGANLFLNLIKQEVQGNEGKIPLRIVGPSPASVIKVSGKYRYKLIIRCKNNKDFRNMIRQVINKYGQNKTYSNVNVFVDINPDNVL